MNRLVKRRSFTFAGLAVLIAAIIPFVTVSQSEGDPTNGFIAFDIAEDGTRFVFDETPVHTDGLPDYGGEFTTQGYIYPAGTLSERDGVTTGVNPDGSPQFPDKVIGTWTCFGTHVGHGAHTRTGAWVATTQIFEIEGAMGRQTIVTSGMELVDLNVPVRRAIVGTTNMGNLNNSEQVQTMTGFNASNGVALKVSFGQ